MNVQGANVLSLLSAPEGVGNIQQGLLGGSADQAGFASALMEQLGLLQGTDSPDLAALQSFMDSASVEGGMQNFAAFFGKNLPTAAKASQDIDLDETLQRYREIPGSRYSCYVNKSLPVITYRFSGSSCGL
jgi:flagellar hook-length control protein FliK